MKRWVKIVSLFIVVCLSVALFCSCAPEENQNYEVYEIGDVGDTGGLKLPIDNNNTEISIMLQTSDSNLSETVIFKELARRTGLKIDTVEVPQSVIKEKVSTFMATGDQYPDIMMGGSSWQETNEYGMQGAFEEILQHKDELPNLKSIYFDNAKEYNTVGKLSNMYASDGGLYMFPTYDMQRDVNHGMLYRKDIFDKHGIKMWTNEDEFYNALKKLKELYPDSTPFVTKNGISVIDNLLGFYGLSRVEFYDEEAGKWKYGGIDERTKELLDFVKKLYNEGLIDKEFVTTTQSAWTQKMSQKDKAFVTYDWIGRLDQFKEQTKDVIPEYDLRYANPISSHQKLISLDNVGAGPRVKAGEKAVLALKLLDYMLSPSGCELMTMGIEGVTYNLDENGKAVHFEFEGRKPNVTELSSKYGAFTTGGYVRADRRSVHFQFTELEQEAQDFPKSKGKGQWPLDPKLTYEKKESDELNGILVNLSRQFDEFAIKYIISKETGDSAWNEWLKKAEKTGVGRVLDILNQAQERYEKLLEGK